MPKDYYVVLGISKGADLKKIKKAYRTIAKKYHPDVASEKESRERFLEIKEAYDTLRDESKKKIYDRNLEQQEKSFEIRRALDIMRGRASWLDDAESLFSSEADEFFEGFLPGIFETGKGPSREKDLFFEAVLTPDEAIKGGLYPITVPVLEPCPNCSKSGLWDDLFCPLCDGYGRVRSEREFSLSIPPNVRHGTEIRLSLEDIGLKECHLNIVVSISDYED